MGSQNQLIAAREPLICRTYAGVNHFTVVAPGEREAPVFFQEVLPPHR